MENFEKNLKEYLLHTNDTAVFLDGNWGLGKTYYIENEIKELFPDFRIIYTSINGVDSIEKIEKQILYKIINQNYKIMSHATGIIELASDFEFNGLKIEKAINRLIRNDKILSKKNNQDSIIVIDDFERLSRDICIEDFLGFILQKLVFNHFKVLIVGNEKMINNKGDYDKIKEKYILHTIAYHPNFSKQLRNITNQRIIKSKLRDFCIKYLNISERILIEAEHKNIRTYIHLLELFRLPYNILLELEAEEFIIKSIFEEILALLIEYKKGELNCKEKIECFERLSLYSLGIDKENKYYNKIHDLYSVNLNINFTSLKSIQNLVIAGLWEEDKFKTETINNFTNNLFREFKIKRDKKDILLKKIIDYKKLEYHDLNNCIKDFLSYIQKGEYVFYRYPYLLSIVYTIKDLEYGILLDIDDIKKQFIDGLKLSMTNNVTYDEREIESTIAHLYNDKYKDDEIILNLKNTILNRKTEVKLSKIELKHFFKLINNEINELERLEIINIDRVSLVKSLSEEDCEQFYRDLSNQGIYWLEVLFKGFFENYYGWLFGKDSINIIVKIIQILKLVKDKYNLETMKRKRFDDLIILLENSVSKHNAS